MNPFQKQIFPLVDGMLFFVKNIPHLRNRLFYVLSDKAMQNRYFDQKSLAKARHLKHRFNSLQSGHEL
jgi:hypothetical protein